MPLAGLDLSVKAEVALASQRAEHTWDTDDQLRATVDTIFDLITGSNQQLKSYQRSVLDAALMTSDDQSILVSFQTSVPGSSLRDCLCTVRVTDALNLDHCPQGGNNGTLCKYDLLDRGLPLYQVIYKESSHQNKALSFVLYNARHLLHVLSFLRCGQSVFKVRLLCPSEHDLGELAKSGKASQICSSQDSLILSFTKH